MATEHSRLIAPYGGSLVDLRVPEAAVDELRAYAGRLPSLQLSERSVCDLEVLATGGFSPLDRFMRRADYERVLHEMRIANGHLFPIPLTLPVERGPAVRLDQEVALRNAKNELLAVLTIEEIYEWDPAAAAQLPSGPKTRVIPWWRKCSDGAGSRCPGLCV